jgi:N-acyl-D-amino-acid deacylase
VVPVSNMRFLLLASLVFLTGLQDRAQTYDIVIRNGTIYDGSGNSPFRADLAIQNDTIAFIGDLQNATGKEEIDATGLAVTPGFINMLSWSEKTLLLDGRSMSDIKQGVTLEIFGEGFSPGPVKRLTKKKADSLYTTLDGYFKWISKKGISPNVASFVGATTVRMYVLEQQNRTPNKAELEQMKKLVAEAMQDGAMGLGSSLIYAPATYASTKELIALSKVAASYGGIYITHMRSEGDFINGALNEALDIARKANIPTEIYHLKVNLPRNWPKLDGILNKIDSARTAGLKITANMYPYIASGTGLTSRLPTWILEGGAKMMRRRLKDPTTRKKVLYEMETGIPYKNSDPALVVLMGFRSDSLNQLYKGKRLNDAAAIHGKSTDETTLDLIIEDKSPIESIYYLQTEESVKKIMQKPYVSFGSDAGSMATTKDFEGWGAHPRAYGTFARVLGRYVRDEKVIPLTEAVRRLTSLPAENLKILKRGRIVRGHYADIAIFDPNVISDKATFDQPHQYAVGMHHVIINGVMVLRNGEHTGAKPGRIIRGPGYGKRVK